MAARLGVLKGLRCLAWRGAATGWLSCPQGRAMATGRGFVSQTQRGGGGSGASVEALADLRYPQTWFPKARKMRRKWILHMGPTNSGKTYHALKRLVESDSGCYSGPLRLLAWEVHEKLCEGAVEGTRVPCDLVTGQEKVLLQDARHRSSTIEMVDLNNRVEVAVIDEMQMAASNDRGWAWTRAILGVPAEELHLCGERRALDLMRHLCELCGDDLEVREYERLTSLSMARKSLKGSLASVQGGDCVVAFSRKKIYEYKRQIERLTRHRCCVVYGSLPPQTRKEQARLFNGRHSGSGFDVMVASDAVGMGLNLEIKRIVFSAVDKFDGLEHRELTDGEVLQIAGRAGRYGTASAEGEVTSLSSKDMGKLKSGMAADMPQLQQACIRPEIRTLEEFAVCLTERWHESRGLKGEQQMLAKELPLHQILAAFMRVHKAEGVFFLTDAMDELMQLAELLQDLRMTRSDLFTFAMAPVDPDNRSLRAAFLEMAQLYAQSGRVPLDSFIRLRDFDIPSSALEMKECEEAHEVLELYLWLANQVGPAFQDLQRSRMAVEASNKVIQKGLENMTRAAEPGASLRNQKASRNEAQEAKKDERRSERRRRKIEARRARGDMYL